jgi:hypothetical protein
MKRGSEIKKTLLDGGKKEMGHGIREKNKNLWIKKGHFFSVKNM